jgi:hypothetical protein
MPSRRAFIAASTAGLLCPKALLAHQLKPAPATRPNIAEIDRARILAAAAVATPPPASRQSPDSAAFLAFSLSLPASAAAAQIDPPNAARYTGTASDQLKAWFTTPETRLPTAPTYASFEPLIDLAPLAELTVALPFLPLDPDLLTQLKAWFAEYLSWLTENRTALLARDARNRHGSSWLLQASAIARFLANDTILADCRHRFKTVTIRAQIDANGLFQHELTTENPYRNSLFNFDLLGGVCMALSTRFESVWDYELQDGPGMRSAVAKHAYYIRERVKWPFPSDLAHFNLLPCRRPTLVFAGRAFSEPDYVTLWRTLNPDPTDPDILRSFPIRQPLLWLTQPRPQA